MSSMFTNVKLPTWSSERVDDGLTWADTCTVLMLSTFSFSSLQFWKLLCAIKNLCATDQIFSSNFQLGFLSSYYIWPLRIFLYSDAIICQIYVLLIHSPTWWLTLHFLKRVFWRAIYLFIVLEARSPRSRSLPIQFLMGTCPGLQVGPFSLCARMVEREHNHFQPY